MSQYIVSARKYRPGTFEEMVGQNHVGTTLKNALLSDKLAHAFLFCGPRGVGKTTCARILAKVINCQERGDSPNPCNQCSSCKSFDENASFNIFELDAASNNSVEHIRNLIEQVRFQPQQGSHKIFIIDEVHMLSTQAFNAFLKTLEEPPSYAVFILATTEKHKILPTILSRCQIFDFKRIQPQDIVQQLQFICTEEGIDADTEALHQIAQKSDGAMRDALSIFDKIAGSATDKKITYQDVVANLNLLDYDYFFKTLDACLRSDVRTAILIIDEIIKNGFEPDLFIQGLSEHIRDVLVSRDPATIHLMEGSNELKRRYYEQALVAKESYLLNALNLLNECDLVLPRSNNKRLQIELTMAKLAYLSNAKEVELFSDSNSEKEKKNADPIPGRSHAVAARVVPKIETPEESEVMDLEDDAVEESAEEITRKPDAPESIKPVASPGLSIPTVLGKKRSDHLEKLKQKIKKHEKEQQTAQNNLSVEGIYKAWMDYVMSHTSNSLQAALSKPIIELEDKTLRVILPSPIAKGYALQELGLMDKIRNEFGTPDLILEVTIDKSRFPEYEETETIKTYFTRTEALYEMTQKNPKLVQFMKTLDLKPDDEGR